MAAARGLRPYGELWLGREGEPGLGGVRALILEQIARTGSLSLAARAAGISYRTAWGLLEELNALSHAPLVRSVSGGSRGGGSRLTEHGKRLLEAFSALQQEHGRYLAGLRARAEGLARPAPAVRRTAMSTSARNQLHGRVLGVRKRGLSVDVDLRVGRSGRVRARITRAGLEGLGLRRGDEVFALIKANWVAVAPTGKGNGAAKAAGARDMNRLKGRILSLREAGGAMECVLRLPGGACLVAAFPASEPRAAGLAEGRPAAALFDPANVILGIPA